MFFPDDAVTAGGRGAGSRGQGRDWDRACILPQIKLPRRTGFDTRVPLA